MSEVSPRSSRPLNAAWLGGVCAGLADHLGWSPLVVRVLFVVLASTRLVGVALYLVLWLVMPRSTAGRSAPGIEAATRTGMRSAATELRPVDYGVAGGLGLLGVGLLWIIQTSPWAMDPALLASGLLAAAGLGAIWWQADQAASREVRRAGGLRRWVEPLMAHWTTIATILVGLLAIGTAIAIFVATRQQLSEVGRILVVLGAAVVALVLVSLPWILRVRQSLAEARDDKLLADARADMAAHLHDSVLQTLALIQRQAKDPRAVVRLARRQERELRQWLYGETTDESTLSQALASAALDVETDHGIDVDLVTVGDCDLTGDVTAVVRAAREAMVNAARHSGVDRVDVYAEVDPDQVSVYIRDRGAGFDPASIDPDRMGIRGSIVERVRRAGGRAIIRSSPGEGSEVRLELPR
ncbi:MAG: PspC domain-containing protein [Propionicimonas sp.]|nr:PspC domain-containing protein [Propionicimonas sp.]